MFRQPAKKTRNFRIRKHRREAELPGREDRPAFAVEKWHPRLESVLVATETHGRVSYLTILCCTWRTSQNSTRKSTGKPFNCRIFLTNPVHSTPLHSSPVQSSHHSTPGPVRQSSPVLSSPVQSEDTVNFEILQEVNTVWSFLNNSVSAAGRGINYWPKCKSKWSRPKEAPPDMRVALVYLGVGTLCDVVIFIGIMMARHRQHLAVRMKGYKACMKIVDENTIVFRAHGSKSACAE